MRRSIPSITSLLCFEAGAQSGSFTQAARDLNMTQSAVSRQIKLLEAFLGQQLFVRVRQRVRLTPAGRRLFRDMAPQLESLEATILRIRTFDRTSGSINVGVYPTLGSRWLMPILVEFAKVQSQTTVNTITYLSNAELNPELIDLAVVQGDPPWPGYRADYLMPEDLGVVGAPALIDGPLSDPRQLFSYRILQHATRPLSWPTWFKDLGEPFDHTPTGPMFSQFEMLIEALVSGHGLAMVPLLLVERELADGRLILAHKHIARPASAYYLLTPDHKAATPKIEPLRRWLLENHGVRAR